MIFQPIIVEPNPNGTITIDIPNTVGNQVLLQLTEDDNPLTSPKAGSLKVEACYHPYGMKFVIIYDYFFQHCRNLRTNCLNRCIYICR